MDVVQNRSAQGGTIYDGFDTSSRKILKSLGYSANNILALFQQLFGESVGKRGKEVLAKEIGQVPATILSYFSFPYVTDREAVQKKQQLDRLMQKFNEEVGLNRVQTMLRQGEDMDNIKEFMEGRERRQEEAMRRLSKLLDSFDQLQASGLTTQPRSPRTLREQLQRDESKAQDTVDTGVSVDQLNPQQ